jgi:hypothetical protein
MMTWLGWWLSKFVCLATNSLGSLGLKQQLDEMVKVHEIQMINILDLFNLDQT